MVLRYVEFAYHYFEPKLMASHAGGSWIIPPFPGMCTILSRTALVGEAARGLREESGRVPLRRADVQPQSSNSQEIPSVAGCASDVVHVSLLDN